MLEIERVYFGDLTAEQQEDQPDNGHGKEDASYIKMTHRGEVIAVYSDAMEPEDCSFGRDLGWIVGAIDRAYALGKVDT